MFWWLVETWSTDTSSRCPGCLTFKDYKVFWMASLEVSSPRCQTSVSGSVFWTRWLVRAAHIRTVWRKRLHSSHTWMRFCADAACLMNNKFPPVTVTFHHVSGLICQRVRGSLWTTRLKTRSVYKSYKWILLALVSVRTRVSFRSTSLPSERSRVQIPQRLFITVTPSARWSVNAPTGPERFCRRPDFI